MITARRDNRNQANSNTGQMSGNVSSNGETFTSYTNNKSYKVDNPIRPKVTKGNTLHLSCTLILILE